MMRGDDPSQAWYLTEGQRGQQLLDDGRAVQAREVFEAMLEGGRGSSGPGS